MTLEALQSVPLFAALGDPTTREFRDLLIMRAAPAGALLFRAWGCRRKGAPSVTKDQSWD